MKKSKKSGKRRKMFFWLLLISFVIVLVSSFILYAEKTLRNKGQKPYVIHDKRIIIEPGGKFIINHPLLGYTMLPGMYKITLLNGYSFTVTHNSETYRITGANNLLTGEAKKEVWILGCSYTYGWSLNDHETYPWLLQQRYPNLKIKNMGVSSYGTIQALIQLRQTITPTKKPYMAIITYADFHDWRNTFLRRVRKQIYRWSQFSDRIQPYARIDKHGKLHFFMSKNLFYELPFMRHSVLINTLERYYNRKIEDFFYNSHNVSKAIMREIEKLSDRHGIKLVVAGITQSESTNDMLAYCRSLGIETINIAVDLRQPGYKNLPNDSHPSAVANKEYAFKHYALFNRFR